MRKITCLEIVFVFLSIFALLALPILAGHPAFAGQQLTFTPQQDQGQTRVYDPYERTNKKVFTFNDRFYMEVAKPIAKAYEHLPKRVREIIHNGFDNLEIPARFVNFVLQGRPHRAGDEMTRFVINSTVGIGGMFDVANNALGVPDHNADFGETLGKWGVHPGAFLMVPIMGPSDQRDLFGFVVDSAMDPLFWVPGAWWITVPPSAVKYTDLFSLEIGPYEAMKKAALDPYVSMRNGYMQHRAHVISTR